MRFFFFISLLYVCLSVQGQKSAASAEPIGIKLTDSVKCPAVSDQSQSPTCWAFGTNSLFESDLMKKYGIEVNLSEMFIARHAYIDKARAYLATKGKSYFDGGGQFHDVIRVIETHGMVPEEVYSGLREGKYNHNHHSLDSAMKSFMADLLKKGRPDLTTSDLKSLNDILDTYLGKVPQVFWYQQRLYTPRSFAKEFTRFNNDYLELVSFADQTLYSQFILKDKYNWANDSFYNLTLTDLLEVVDTALSRGWSVGWEGDVTESAFHYYSGYAAYEDAAHDYDNERLLNYKNESTERDHMLHIVGAGRDINNKKWYYMKNSWGTFLSRLHGYLYMEENYFRLKTVIIFVNRAAIPQRIKNKAGIK